MPRGYDRVILGVILAEKYHICLEKAVTAFFTVLNHLPRLKTIE